MAEEAYGAQDLDAIMRLFHPDAIVYWDGEKVASGLDEVRRFHVERLGFGEVSRHDYELTKTLRAAQGDTVAVEWQSRYRTADGSLRAARAAEVWTLRGDQLVEWHAYYHRSRDRGRMSNRFCALVGCRLPLQQAGMGRVATPALAAAVSEAGGLGMLAFSRHRA